MIHIMTRNFSNILDGIFYFLKWRFLLCVETFFYFWLGTFLSTIEKGNLRENTILYYGSTYYNDNIAL